MTTLYQAPVCVLLSTAESHFLFVMLLSLAFAPVQRCIYLKTTGFVDDWSKRQCVSLCASSHAAVVCVLLLHLLPSAGPSRYGCAGFKRRNELVEFVSYTLALLVLMVAVGSAILAVLFYWRRIKEVNPQPHAPSQSNLNHKGVIQARDGHRLL